MSRFTPGQQVVCTKKGAWYCGYGPAYNEIVVVLSDCLGYPGYINIKNYLFDPADGFPIGHAEEFFEPLISDAVLYRELSEVEITA